ncbi:hypothetical protein [Paraflavitalea speifideaquila]|uniref:hypothetical protein n=1 Tax=Paraflavitalea speifideaquila TaxID=3076558 RepID=UPI0028E6E7CD|nr:hypothetical protein [Paraflavitalea speifideiaquila]
MYNLIITAQDDAWNGKTFTIERERCVTTKEYTDASIVSRLGDFSAKSIDELKSIPCIFAFESFLKQPPLFGWLTKVRVRSKEILLDYEIHQLHPWIDENQLKDLQSALDIQRYEFNRSHWAVKDVDLREEMEALGIKVPVGHGPVDTMDVVKGIFEVAFSFPGESRTLVEDVLSELKKILPAGKIFYDFDYQSALARPALDQLLLDLYGNRARLLVVFLSGHYDIKKWCGLEFRAIQALHFNKEYDRIMYFKVDDKPVKGILPTDGYINVQSFTPKQMAQFISERVQVARRAAI